MNFPRAEADDGNRQDGNQPIEITEFLFLQNGNHVQLAVSSEQQAEKAV